MNDREDGLPWTRLEQAQFQLLIAVNGSHFQLAIVGTTQRFAAIAGGYFEGDRLRGIVLPGGDDWITIRDDGASLLNARAVLKVEDETIIGMSWTGIRHGSVEVMRRIAAGEDVDPDSYYFRANFSFATADRRYGWINRILASARGRRGADAVDYSVFELL